MAAALAVALAGCSDDTDTPSDPGTAQGDIRVQCERQASPNRSKISVDGNNVVRQNGAFRARVTAAGGSVTSPTRHAVGDEVEFDFDSNPNDVAEEATAIVPSHSGPCRRRRDRGASQFTSPGGREPGRGVSVPLTGGSQTCRRARAR